MRKPFGERRAGTNDRQFRLRLASITSSVKKSVKPMSGFDAFGKDEYWT
ncbi:hypothetical protein BQ8482_360119 [Mesorhizobium delmotii]|uniref:Uncharacterized protein n=1 Tax=Mesorhizobium delmotii TaxID=1631247 RepID=A0A2P9ARC5_9HYPH|nr:hypothetical protein BQ8482_360119 [Mesorhizobium delmotii]